MLRDSIDCGLGRKWAITSARFGLGSGRRVRYGEGGQRRRG
jgi:hypothetical protein